MIGFAVELKKLAAPPFSQLAEDCVEAAKDCRVDVAAAVFRDENSMEIEVENTMIKRIHRLFGWHNEGTL